MSHRPFLDAPNAPSRGPVRPLFALSAIVLAAAIFLFDTYAPIEIAISVLYGIVILLAAPLFAGSALAFVAAGCALLTVLSYVIVHGTDMLGAAVLRCMVSLAAIVITTVLALRMQAAMAVLRASEHRYRRIFESTAVGIWEEDYTGVAALLREVEQQVGDDLEAHLLAHPELVARCMRRARTVDVNAAAVRMLQATDKRQVIESLPDLFLPESFGLQARLLAAFMAGRDRFEGANAIRSFNGERRSVLIAATFPPHMRQEEHVFVSVLDVTERSKTEQALEQTRAELAHVTRVATMGELTASIAHEVNQPLAAVVTQAEAALRWLRRTPPELGEVSDALNAIVLQGRRAGEVVRRLRAMSRDVEPSRMPIDINEVVQEAVALLRRELTDHAVELRLALAAGKLEVAGDRIQLQQVVINLMMNGMQAMDAAPARVLEIRSRHLAEAVEIAVVDCGRGLPEADMTRLFTAFFTTREHGMGMGLSICRSIVESHGGRIRAERNAGMPGATFAFTLPTHAAAIAARPDDVAGSAAPRHGTA